MSLFWLKMGVMVAMVIYLPFDSVDTQSLCISLWQKTEASLLCIEKSGTGIYTENSYSLNPTVQTLGLRK
jgi:hypothetical protein